MNRHYHSVAISDHVSTANGLFADGWRIASLSVNGSHDDPRVAAVYMRGTGGRQIAGMCDEAELNGVLAASELLGQYAVAIAGTGTGTDSYAVTFVVEQLHAEHGTPKPSAVSAWQTYDDFLDPSLTPPGLAVQFTSNRYRCAGLMLLGDTADDLSVRALWRHVPVGVPLQGLQRCPEDVPIDQLASAIDVMAPRRARLRATYMYGSAVDVRRILLWEDPNIDERSLFAVSAEQVETVITRQRATGFDIQRIAAVGNIDDGEAFDLTLRREGARPKSRSFKMSEQHLGSTGAALFAPVDAAMESFIKDHNIRAMQLAIAHHGKLKYVRSYSFAEDDFAQPDILQKIAIGSVTKAITATAIMMLLERGLLPNGLDSSVKRILDRSATPFQGFLTDQPNQFPADPRFDELTVDHLLCHASAFSDAGGNQRDLDVAPVAEAVLGVSSIHRPITPQQSMEYYGQLDSAMFDGTKRPGSEIRYQNMNFVILGRVIVALTRALRYLDWVRDHVFTPLGLLDPRRVVVLSNIPGAQGELEYGMCAPTVSADWAHSNTSPEKLEYTAYVNNQEAYDAHGALAMCAADLIRFMTSLDLGASREPTLIGRHTRDKVMWAFPEALRESQLMVIFPGQPAETVTLPIPGFGADNLRGWYIDRVGTNGHTWRQHDGGTGGTGAIAGGTTASPWCPTCYHMRGCRLRWAAVGQSLRLDRQHQRKVGQLGFNGSVPLRWLHVFALGTSFVLATGCSGAPDSASEAPSQCSAKGAEEITMVGANVLGTCVLDGCGRAHCFGESSGGLAGVNSTAVRRPHLVPGAVDIASMYVGDSYAVAIQRDGTVIGWGENGFYTLGSLPGGPVAAAIPEMPSSPTYLVAGQATVGFVSNGVAEFLGASVAPGNLARTPQPIELGGDLLQMSARGLGWCLARTDNSVVCMGWDDYQQLGRPGPERYFDARPVIGLPPAREVALNDFFGCALTTGGDVWCWGKNDWGQVGKPPADASLPASKVDGLPSCSNVVVEGTAACALTEDGEVYCWGAEGQLGPGYVPTVVVGIADATTLVAGDAHACALERSGELLCWGGNAEGELGIGDLSGRSQYTPQHVTLDDEAPDGG